MCLPPSFDYLTPKEKLMSLEAIREHHTVLQNDVLAERRARYEAGERPRPEWTYRSPEEDPAEFAWAEHVEEHRQAKARRDEIRRLTVVRGHVVGVAK